MPLDGRNWKQDTETKPDVFSLEGLIAWLEKQPEETEYNFMDCDGGCLIGKYLIATTGKHWTDFGLRWGCIIIYYPAIAKVAAGEPQTYGAALSRARALLAETRK